MANDRHRATAEGGLHDLTDDEYFDDLNNHRVQILDAGGSVIEGIYDDVVDRREEKKAGLL